MYIAITFGMVLSISCSGFAGFLYRINNKLFNTVVFDIRAICFMMFWSSFIDIYLSCDFHLARDDPDVKDLFRARDSTGLSILVFDLVGAILFYAKIDNF